MSTILKALRRLEDDDPKKKASPPGAPDVDALRIRILAEEAAARAARAEPETPPVDVSPSSGRLGARARRLIALAAVTFVLGLAFVAHQTNLFGAGTPPGVTPPDGLAAGSNPSPIQQQPTTAPQVTGTRDRPARAMVAVPTPSTHPTPEHAAAERARLASLAAAAATTPQTEAATVTPPSEAAPTAARPMRSAPPTAAKSAPPIDARRPSTSIASAAVSPSASPAAPPSASAPTSRPRSPSAAPPPSASTGPQHAAVPVESLPIARGSAVADPAGAPPRPPVGAPATAKPETQVKPATTSSPAPRESEARVAAAPPSAAARPADARTAASANASAASTTVPDRGESPAPVESDSRATDSPDVQRITATQPPKVTVLRTAWHPKAERRSAKLRILATGETLTVHEGDAAAGLVIKEVTPSSVVFDAGGIEIRRRVGESAGAR
ncbi:MAG: hypothetical protein R3F35_11610 [Myxococcota bacterium]